MDSTKSSAAHAHHIRTEALLAQLEERYRHELMGDKERLELGHRINRLQCQAGYRTASSALAPV